MTNPRLVEKAIDFVKKVKLRFQGNDDRVYKSFLEIMNMFRKGNKTIGEFYDEVVALFREHSDLLEDFTIFLPHTSAARRDQHAPPSTVEFEEATDFVDKIKLRFEGDNHHVYKSFLDILNMYRKENKTIREVYDEVAVLFREYPDVLEEFTSFLPDTPAATPGQHVPPSRPMIVDKDWDFNSDDDSDVDNDNLLEDDAEQRRQIGEVRDKLTEMVIRDGEQGRQIGEVRDKLA